jgi:hypothetical protein
MYKKLACVVFPLVIVSLACLAQLTLADIKSTEPVANAQEQTDLSGTYTGVLDCEVLGPSGETTITIAGNQVTFSDGRTGRITATTTGGYTAVALQVGDASPGTPAKIVSLRARKSGDRLILTSVQGGTKCTFTPARATARRRSKQPATTDTGVTTPTEASPTGERTGAKPPARKRGSRGNANMNANANANANANMNENANTGNANANANANAAPSPTP